MRPDWHSPFGAHILKTKSLLLMKKTILLTCALAAGVSAFAVESPYVGSEPAVGKYYLYNPKADKWLQPNMENIDQWTTLGKLGNVGIEIELRKPSNFAEGYQIYVDFTNNGELNGSDEDRFYFDQGDRDICEWIFNDAGNEGVEKGYTIWIRSREGSNGNRSKIQVDTYIGSNEGALSDQPDYEGEIWQLVTREERLRVMQEQVANGPVDCTWLIPWFDLGRNDHRDQLWAKTVNNPSGGGLGFDGSRGYPVQEYWHEITMSKSITLEGLPEGSYSFAVQAYYRKDIGSGDFYNEWKEGTVVIPAKYFAGDAYSTVKCIFDDAKTVQGGGFERYIEPLGLWVPDALDQASPTMYNGNYVNEYIATPVTDGTLTIGIEKIGASWHDWFVEKRYYLRYDSKTPGEVDLTSLKTQLNEIISKAKEMYQTSNLAAAISEGEAALNNVTTARELVAAADAIKAAYNDAKAALGTITIFQETLPLAKAAGADTQKAEEQFANEDFDTAVKTLRYARRIAAMPVHKDEFRGNEPKNGSFYLYNIGRGLFLEGGADWGAHAALGYVGTELTLTKIGTNDNGDDKYLVHTGLPNGNRGNLNYRGYMDSDTDIDGFTFLPVDGKSGVYNMVQGDYVDALVVWDPYASTDGGNNNELTVGTEGRGFEYSDINAQWKLVTREERLALLVSGSKENPVDCSFLIQNPGFNQRASIDAWQMNDFSVWDRGGNHPDFIGESWTKPAGATLQQTIEGLRGGLYEVSVQGFYRNSTTHKGQTYGEFNGEEGKGVANVDRADNAFFFANDEEMVALPYVLDEAGNAPGEGANAVSEDGSKSYNIPDNGDQAAIFFRTGLYNVTPIRVNLPQDNMPLTIGVTKTEQGELGDWVVVDNFRLKYLGYDFELGVENVTEEAPADNRIFNLQGIEVENATVPGIYISNGKKFIVK